MSLFHASAGQAEIIRTVQKDYTITDQLGNEYSEILRASGNNYWIKYNGLCKLLAELSYHGYSSWNGLQTLGEEFTGIIQVDKNYIAIPHKIIQFVTILLEFGGDALTARIIKSYSRNIEENDEILPEAKVQLLRILKWIQALIPYIKAMHRSWFYMYSGKYQISKRLTGINYVLVRHWLKENQSIYGYRILGIFSFVQILLSAIVTFRQKLKIISSDSKPAIKSRVSCTEDPEKITQKCVLCLEVLNNASVTKCGHVFCWECILDWLAQKLECPICREPLRKSQTVFLQNYF